jgi:hypothetical protein
MTAEPKSPARAIDYPDPIKLADNREEEALRQPFDMSLYEEIKQRKDKREAEKARIQKLEDDYYAEDLGAANETPAQTDKQGGIVPQDLAVAKRVDLITLPQSVRGTNCFNCRWVQHDGSGVGFCDHPKVQQEVNARNCCALWDNEGVIRPWGEEQVALNNETVEAHGDDLGLAGTEPVEQPPWREPYTGADSHYKQVRLGPRDYATFNMYPVFGRSPIEGEHEAEQEHGLESPREFTFTRSEGPTEYGTMDIAGQGQAGHVMSHATEALHDYLTHHRPSYVKIGAYNINGSRAKLYRHVLAKAFEKLKAQHPDYVIGGSPSGMEFYITHKAIAKLKQPHKLSNKLPVGMSAEVMRGHYTSLPPGMKAGDTAHGRVVEDFGGVACASLPIGMAEETEEDLLDKPYRLPDPYEPPKDRTELTDPEQQAIREHLTGSQWGSEPIRIVAGYDKPHIYQKTRQGFVTKKILTPAFGTKVPHPSLSRRAKQELIVPEEWLDYQRKTKEWPKSIGDMGMVENLKPAARETEYEQQMGFDRPPTPKKSEVFAKQLQMPQGWRYQGSEQEVRANRQRVAEAMKQHRAEHPHEPQEESEYPGKTPQFDRWFKGSKAVDHRGQPLDLFTVGETEEHEFDPHAAFHFAFTDPETATEASGGAPSFKTNVTYPALQGTPQKVFTVNGYDQKTTRTGYYNPGLSKDFVMIPEADGQITVTHKASGKTGGITSSPAEALALIKAFGESGLDFNAAAQDRPSKEDIDKFYEIRKQLREQKEAGAFDQSLKEWKKEGYKGTKVAEKRYGDAMIEPFGVGSNMKVLHASIKHPLDMTHWDDLGPLGPATFKEYMRKAGITEPARFYSLRSPTTLQHRGWGRTSGGGKGWAAEHFNALPDKTKLRTKLIQAGYDGVILPWRNKQGKEMKVYVALHPEQFKSASGNSGQYSRLNPDIRTSNNLPIGMKRG